MSIIWLDDILISSFSSLNITNSVVNLNDINIPDNLNDNLNFTEFKNINLFLVLNILSVISFTFFFYFYKINPDLQRAPSKIIFNLKLL